MRHAVGGPGPLNAVTESPQDNRTIYDWGGGGQPVSLPLSLSPPPPPPPHGINGSTRVNQAGCITSNGLQAPSASHLGSVQLPSRLVGKNLSISFRVVKRLGGGGVSSHHSALGSHTRTAIKKRWLLLSGSHTRVAT